MDSDTDLEADHKLGKQASTFKKLRSSALSRTQQALSSHLTAGNLSINLLMRPLLSNLAAPLPKQRDLLTIPKFPMGQGPLGGSERTQLVKVKRTNACFTI